jgi:hypothetical protein
MGRPKEEGRRRKEEGKRSTLENMATPCSVNAYGW